MDSGTLFAQRLKELRKERKLTQIQFAQKFNVSNGAIGMWETGKREPDFDTVNRLAKFFHVSADYLLGNVNDPWAYLDNEQMLREINSYEDSEADESQQRGTPLPAGLERIDLSKYHKIPILGRISAGLPIYAGENIEGYTLTDLNGGAEYFGLRVSGDSMNAARINDGDIVIVRRQEEVESGQVAVVLVDGDNATVKRFYSTSSTVTLMPQSTNPAHQPQIYDLQSTDIKILGRVIKVEFTL